MSGVSTRPGITLGVGLGGFADGIALHQLLQWHNMLSSAVPPVTMDAMRTNMRADGLFHGGVWLATLLGVYWLLADARGGRALPSPRRFTGQMLLGWGAFNVVEGVADHLLLDVHHVRDLPTHVPLYDWLFLLVGGAGLLLLGWLLAREGRSPTAGTSASRRPPGTSAP
jgi:uncharacterized membrane protein